MMSRRSAISEEAHLLRAAQRNVPNARMWSESPVPPDVAWDGYEEEPPLAPPDPVWMMALSYTQSGGRPGSGGYERNVALAANPLLVGARIVVCVSWRETKSLVIAPGWTEIAAKTAEWIGLKWLTRIYDPNQLGIIAGHEASDGGRWPSVDVFGYAFEGFTTPAVDIAGSTPGWVVLHQPTRGNRDRFRFLTGSGFYNSWENVNPPGIDHGKAGYIHIGTSSNGNIGQNPVAEGYPSNDPHKALAPWSTKSWWSGYAEHGTIGTAGPLRWIESHLYVVEG